MDVVKADDVTKLEGTVMPKGMIADLIVGRTGQFTKKCIGIILHAFQTDKESCRTGEQPKGSNEITVGSRAVVRSNVKNGA
jgi:hypothetical protein